MARIGWRASRGTLRLVPWLVNHDAHVLASAEVAENRSARRRGLLGREHMEGALVLRRCKWIHTIGMRFPIDVAYLDGGSRVIAVRRMQPFRIGRPRLRAKAVLEAEAGAFERWGIHVGDVLEAQ